MKRCTVRGLGACFGGLTHEPGANLARGELLGYASRCGICIDIPLTQTVNDLFFVRYFVLGA
jgi:hypothetical protein